LDRRKAGFPLTMTSAVTLTRVDYRNPQHATDLVTLLDQYAGDVSGGGRPLSDEVKRELAGRLAERPDAVSLLAYVAGVPVGLINCIEGFSTFLARPLLNIHDVTVHADFRRRGIAGELLRAAERIAVERGCCKLTLEVLSGNDGAKRAYERFGFTPYQLDPALGHAVFMEKKLSDDVAIRDATISPS